MNFLKSSFVVCFVLLICFVSNQSFAQVDDKGLFVRVETKGVDADYIRYSGYISDGTNRDTLYLTTRSLRVVRIPFSSILKMESKRGIEMRKELDEERGEAIAEREREDEYVFREQGLYAVLGTEFNFESSNGTELHPAFDATIGYKFNRLFALGIGGSIRSWTYDVWPNAVGHIYLEARGWLLKKGNSPYYRMQIGYGNSWGGGNGNYQDSNGGLYYSPAIGIRLINSKIMQLNLETGFNHQEITYLDLDFGSFERNYKMNRHYVGISMMY